MVYKLRGEFYCTEYCTMRVEDPPRLGNVESTGLHEGFQLDLAFDNFYDVFDVAAILLLLQFFRFFQHEFVEAGARQFSRRFSSRLLGLQERLVQLLDLLRFTLRLGTRHAQCLGLTRRSAGGMLFGFLLRASRFNLLPRRADWPLNFSSFFQGAFLPD